MKEAKSKNHTVAQLKELTDQLLARPMGARIFCPLQIYAEFFIYMGEEKVYLSLTDMKIIMGTYKMMLVDVDDFEMAFILEKK